MKRILLALLVATISLSAVALNTRAAWTDTVTVTNNIITTGTVDLLVSTDSGASWDSTTASSTMVLANLIPGAAATEAYSFSLYNNSTGVTSLALTGQITSTSITPTPGVDKDQIMLQLYEIGGSAESPEVSLATWETLPPQALTTALASGVGRHYGIRARLLSSALNSWQGQTVTFTLSVTGSQP